MYSYLMFIYFLFYYNRKEKNKHKIAIRIAEKRKIENLVESKCFM